MCAYVFLSESELPPARTVRRQAVEIVEEVSGGVAEVMECVTEALMAFPDAYRGDAANQREVGEKDTCAAPVIGVRNYLNAVGTGAVVSHGWTQMHTDAHRWREADL
jgi:hypothetical protein